MQSGTLVAHLALAFFAAFGGEQKSEEPGIEKLREIWQSRHEHITNARFEWHEKLNLPKGSLVNLGTPRAFNPNGLIIPNADVTLEPRDSLKLEGNKVWRRRLSKSWAGESGIARDSDDLNLFDGEKRTYFRPTGIDAFPSATIRSASYALDLVDLHAKAIFLGTKPAHPSLGLMTDFVMDKERKRVDTTVCCILTCERPSGVVETVWVAVEDGYAVRRWTKTGARDGALIEQLDITYVTDKKFGLVPIAWKGLALKSDQTVRTTFSARVDRYTINGASMAKDFQMDFPPGTHVDDLDSKTSYIVPRAKKKSD